MKLTKNYTLGHSVRADTMEVGQMGEVVNDQFGKKGTVVLRTYSGFVSLNNPKNTWSTPCYLKVRVLQPGESVTLTA